MDSDIELVLEEIFKHQGKDRKVAIDAFFELIKKENIPAKVQDEIYELFKKGTQYNKASWLKALGSKYSLENALHDLDFDQFLRDLKSD